MKYQELIDSCQKAIAESRCLGCQALENIDFKGNPNCRYSKKTEYKQERINEIHNQLQIR